MSEEEGSDSESKLIVPYKEKSATIRNKVSSGIYKLQQIEGRSKVWSIFKKIEDENGFILPDKVCCISCFCVLSFSKRTSYNNLARHKCFAKQKLSMLNNISSLTKTEDVTCSKKATDRNLIRNNIITGVYKLRTKLSGSKVWQIFRFIEDNEGNKLPNKVCCKMCFQVLNNLDHTTSNLVKHKCYVLEKHKLPSFKYKRGITKMKESNSSEDLKMKGEESMEPNSYTDWDEFPPTKEWEEPYASQEMAKQPPPDENVDNNLKTEIEKIFSDWCIENFRPFKLSQDSGLRRFAEFMMWVGANYGTSINLANLLPESEDIAKTIDSKFEEAFINTKHEIADVCRNGCGLTSKIWFDSYWQQSYISLTIHYIKNGRLATKLLGLHVARQEENTNDIIEAKLQETLDNYDCFCKDSIIVTDGSLHMLTEVLNNFIHIGCINHILDNVVNESIKEIKELEKLKNQCLEIKEFFSQANFNCKLSAIFDSLCPTKWNSFYYLLSIIKRNWLEIENILQLNDRLLECEGINELRMEQVLNTLKPFEHVSKKLESKDHPTIHLVYACINGLKASCSAESNDDYTIRRFKAILSKHLQNTVISNLSITHKIALFLFPPANKLIQFSEDEKNLTKSEISSLLKPYAQSVCKPVQKPTATSSEASTMITSYLKNFVTLPTSNSSSDQISSEIHNYECVNVPFEDNFDILQWWHLRQTQFPLLYKLSCKILATPATCAASGLVLSMVRQIAENNTSILSNSEKLSQLIFLNFNSKKSTMFEELYSEEIRIENNVIEEI